MVQDKLLTARESAIEATKQTVMLEAAQADKDRLEREKAALQSELEAARHIGGEKSSAEVAKKGWIRYNIPYQPQKN